MCTGPQYKQHTVHIMNTLCVCIHTVYYTVYKAHTEHNRVFFDRRQNFDLVNFQWIVETKAGLKHPATIFARPTLSALGEHLFF